MSAPTRTGTDLEQRLAQFSTYETTPDAAFALFAEAREAGISVFRSEKLDGFHVFLDYADVKAAHQDWETYNSGPAVLRPLAERPAFPPIEYDPPAHTQWRELFAQALNPNTPNLIEDDVRADVTRLLSELATRERFDLQADFAEEIPLLALCHVLGFDRCKRAEVRRHTVAMHATAGDPEKGVAAFMAFAEFGAREVYARLQDPRDDFLTALSRWEIDGRALTAPELGATMNSFLNAGHGTTVSGLTSLLFEVLSRPQLRARLIADPSLVPAAVEESMRLHTPFFGLYRTTTRPLSVGGVDLPEGSSVLMMWAAANRDPKVFPNPDEFDLDREVGRNRLMTFGFGIHGCMGQPMARMEMHVALTELLARLPDIELVDPGSVRHEFAGSETALIKSLPARLASPTTAMATPSTQTKQASRPVERYLGGVHHMAQPTVDPAATMDFYSGVMGAKITHCVSSKGWRPGHYDYIHMFLDLGKGDNIAMFYYFGVEDPKDWPRVGTHHSFAANSLEELAQWADWLEANGHEIVQRNTYEVFSSVYVWDPNGRFLEIAANHRPLNDLDAEDAELTAAALRVAAEEKAPKIDRMWEVKAGLVEERYGDAGDGPVLILPNLEEFAWIGAAAGETAGDAVALGSFTGLRSRAGTLRLTKPDDLPESLWWSVGTGGVKGTIERHDERELVVGR